MKLDITDVHFIELQKKGYTIDMVLILSWINKNLDISHIVAGSKKIEAIYKTMKRKNLITDDEKVSQIGIEILDFISLKSNKTLIKPKPAASDFDKWWEIFPSNDKFVVRGKTFGPTRSFKANKEEARLLFNKIIISGEFTAEQIIEGTKYDVNLKKERSYKTGQNQLKYLQNSSTYLRHTSFDGFLGLNNKEEPKQSTNLGSIDI